MIETQIEQDLKSAMLARDTDKVSTLRGLKSTFLYSKVEAGKKDSQLSDKDAITLLQREAKKRQESADIYSKGGETSRADQELKEKGFIEAYLPAKLSEDELTTIVNEVISNNPDENLGQIISKVKDETAGSADGSDIARIVKGKLES